MTRMKLFAAAILLALAGVALGRAQTPPAGRPTGYKFLFVGDTREFPGGDVAFDIDAMNRYAAGLPGVDPKRDVKVLTGAAVTAANILQAIDDLDVGPNDSLLCFIDGHGAYDPRLAHGDPLGGHLLQIRSGDLLRTDLMAHLKAKGARLDGPHHRDLQRRRGSTAQKAIRTGRDSAAPGRIRSRPTRMRSRRRP